MRRGAKSALIGKWRIIEMALWDSDYLDMVEPAYIQFQANGLGEFKFGCVVGGLDCTLFADAPSKLEDGEFFSSLLGGFQINFSVGNIASGVIKVYGIP